MATTYYSCEEKKCSFETAKLNIRENVDLKAYGGTQVALNLVEAIETSLDDFLPHKYDGFQLTRGLFDLLLLKRRGADDKGRTGFIDFNILRAVAIQKASRDQQKLLEDAAIYAG